MSAPDLSPTERAVVERFEQAPDALADGGCVPCEVCGGSQSHGWHRHGPADALAKVIWTASRADEGTISATGANIVARAILDSDWLAERLAEARAEGAAALTAAVREVLPTYPPDWSELTVGYVGLANRVRAVLDASDMTTFCDHAYPPANSDGTCPSCGKARADVQTSETTP